MLAGAGSRWRSSWTVRSPAGEPDPAEDEEHAREMVALQRLAHEQPSVQRREERREVDCEASEGDARLLLQPGVGKVRAVRSYEDGERQHGGARGGELEAPPGQRLADSEGRGGDCPADAQPGEAHRNVELGLQAA